MIRLLITIVAVLIASPAFAWWDCGWGYRFAVDISKPPGPPLTDYEVRLDLDAGNVPAEFDWSSLGDDLRVIDEDDLTELVFYVEEWDAIGQAATVWVRVPQVPGGGRTVYLYFDGPAGSASTSTTLTFTETGVRFYTRQSGADPTDLASAEAAFAAASDANGYGCATIPAYTGVNNRILFGPPNRNSDIALFAEAFFEVTPAQAGVWQFRYGADFGRGGGLYVDDVPLEEDWDSDLWWANDWNDASNVLQGSISLAAGTHSIRILGFEGCCDGGLTAQFQPPGGSWQALSTVNLNLLSASCPATSVPTVTYGAVESSGCPDLAVTRTSQPLTEPLPIPSAVILNSIGIENGAAGTVDANTIVITEALAPDAELSVVDFDGVTNGPVQFVDGAVSSGISYTFIALADATDDIAFSNDNGATFGYTPVADANGLDAAVTHIRITPQGIFQGDAGAGAPMATFLFKTVIP